MKVEQVLNLAGMNQFGHLTPVGAGHLPGEVLTSNLTDWNQAEVQATGHPGNNLDRHQQSQPTVHFPEEYSHWRIITIFWQDAAMSLPLIIQFALCPLVFLSLIWKTAPYGRHHQQGWGPDLPNRMAWVLMELPALLVISWLVLASPAGANPQAWVPLGFWIFHYSYRTFVFPALMQPSEKTFPALLVLFAVAFNSLNGYNNAAALVEAGAKNAPLLTVHFLTGALVFLAGFLIHFTADRTIRRLREPGEIAYRIPQGGLFRWVSSPHYLGEIIQWTGWAIMTWSLAGVAFALFTFCNLAPRAVSNHRWYRKRFADYPANRRILIPGVF
jgi:3-oxo-5-alpha-steroid 4-dehydrogenase 1